MEVTEAAIEIMTGQDVTCPVQWVEAKGEAMATLMAFHLNFCPALELMGLFTPGEKCCNG